MFKNSWVRKFPVSLQQTITNWSPYILNLYSSGRNTNTKFVDKFALDIVAEYLTLSPIGYNIAGRHRIQELKTYLVELRYSFSIDKINIK